MARIKTGRVTFYNRNGVPLRSFTPTGKMRPNRAAWSSGPIDAARLFVGFNVGDVQEWNMEEVIDVVRTVRREQAADPGSSFIAQKGMYRDRRGGLTEENGAQIIILNVSEIPRYQFENQIMQLAEHMRHELQQEEVIVEFQHGGVAYKTVGIQS